MAPPASGAKKQATLGYVKSGQTTIGKFFGKQGDAKPAPQQQSKLSFKSKGAVRSEGSKENDTEPSEDGDAKAMAEVKKAEDKSDAETGDGGVEKKKKKKKKKKSASSSLATKKSETKTKKEVVKDGDGDASADEAPAAQKGGRGRPKKQETKALKVEDRNESETSVSKKRGRGRPKKQEEAAKENENEDEDEDEDDDAAPLKKRIRRGRPQIKEDEDSDDVMADADAAADASVDAEAVAATAKKTAASPKSGKKKSPSKALPTREKKAKEVKEEDEEDEEEEEEEEEKVSSAADTSSEVENVEEQEEEEGRDDDEDDGKSSGAAKKAEPKAKAKAKAKTKTKSNAKNIVQDPYPDWKAGAPVPYAALCKTFSHIELTTKRLEIIEHCSLFLQQVLRLSPEDFLSTVLLMINKLAPDYAGIELGIGESLIVKAIGESTGRSANVIRQDQREIGDLGLVAIKSRSTQPTMFKPTSLTVRGVHKGLMDIATTMMGSGAQGKKVDGIKKLLSAADAHSTGKVDITKDKGGPSEAKYIVRFLEGKLRLGLAERTVIVAIAQATMIHEVSKEDRKPTDKEVDDAEAMVKAVYSELPSWNVIIPAILDKGVLNLRENCKLRPGVPLKPMLAKPTKAITEVLDRFENQTFTCEFKYDGERAQIHYVHKDHANEFVDEVPGASKSAAKGIASIFSRNSEDLSQKYPDVLAKLHTWIKPGTTSFVLDCETVAWDVTEKKVLPFQQLMTRKKKDVKIQDVKIKVCIFAFDLLFLNGEAIVTKSLRDRRALLHSAFQPVQGEFAYATAMDGQDLDAIQGFLDDSVKASCEGLMVKMLDGPESGYEPSMRSRNWLKIKKDYLSGIGDSLDLVVLGAYHGKGKRTSLYGAFLLACYNPASDSYETICNIGTGFSEAVLESLHAQLTDLVIDKPKPFYAHSPVPQHQPDVWFEPKYVWEVKTADLTLSPRYKAGLQEGVDGKGGGRGISLRFPRFVKERDDKKADMATTSKQVAEMYRRQEAVAGDQKGGVDDDFEY